MQMTVGDDGHGRPPIPVPFLQCNFYSSAVSPLQCPCGEENSLQRAQLNYLPGISVAKLIIYSRFYSSTVSPLQCPCGEENSSAESASELSSGHFRCETDYFVPVHHTTASVEKQILLIPGNSK